MPLLLLLLLLLLQIMEEIQQNGINIYQFPTTDETVADLNRKMNVSNYNNCYTRHNTCTCIR